MAGEPTNNEEYLRKVLEQAEAQADEKVPSHQDVQGRVKRERRHYEEKLQFFSLLLVILVVSYIAVKVLPGLWIASHPHEY